MPKFPVNSPRTASLSAATLALGGTTTALAAQVPVLDREGQLERSLVTDDARAVYQRMVAAGVETVGEPMEQVYGVDFGFRDPSGNHYRVATRRAVWP